MTQKAILIITLSFIYSCTEHKKTEIEDNNITTNHSYISAFHDKKIMDKLKENVINSGDTIAFMQLRDNYFLGGENPNDFLYYAMYMAENYKYSKAYSTVYTLLRTDVITPVNERTNKIANYYLLKAYEDGDKTTIYTIIARGLRNSEIQKSEQYWDSFN